MIHFITFLINPKRYLKTRQGKYKLRIWSIKVRKRDKKCLKCGAIKPLEAHHIFPKHIYPRKAFSLKNGVTLCRKCHRTATYSYHHLNGYDGNKQMFHEWLKLAI